MFASLNILDHPIFLSVPRRMTVGSSWHEHIPFGMFLVDIMKPQVIVELGTQYGDSFCAFCQAVQELHLATRCYAIDTWQGDPHTGFYGPEVLDDLRRHHDFLYGSFSSLIQSTFDEALKHFKNRSIDLLHIDGYHTYEVVRHDFEAWLKKISSRGVILLHDINVLEHDFGIREFWDEIRLKYPHFEFEHGHGLGILFIGKDQSESLRKFVNITHNEAQTIRNIFYELGRRLTLELSVVDKDHNIAILEEEVEKKKHIITKAESDLRERDIRLFDLQKVSSERRTIAKERDFEIIHLQQIIRSWQETVGWKMLERFRHVRDKMLPPRSRRRYLIYDLPKGVAISLKRKNIGNKVFLRLLSPNKRFDIQTTEYKDYDHWILLNEPNNEGLVFQRNKTDVFKYRPVIGVVVETEYKLVKDMLRRSIDSLRNQTYNRWEVIVIFREEAARNEFDAIGDLASSKVKVAVIQRYCDLNRVITNENWEYLCLLKSGDTLAPFALYRVIEQLNSDPNLDILYTDEDDLVGQDFRRTRPRFKPSFSPDLLRSYNYIHRLSVLRQEFFLAIGGFDEEDGDGYQLMLKALINTKRVSHIPYICYHSLKRHSGDDQQAEIALKQHLLRSGLLGTVEPGLDLHTFRVRYAINTKPLVSILVPVRDRVNVLKQCIDSLLLRTKYPHYEILVIDNQSRERETLDYIQDIQKNDRIRVASYDRPFNYSALNNYAVNLCRGKVLLFLNSDAEVINEGWLEAMLEHALRKETGVVGAKLYYPDNTVQHGGILLGIAGVAGHLHRRRANNYPGYLEQLNVVRNVSAVTGACMMVRREVFQSVKGFSEEFAVNFGDVDLCLKVMAKGFLNVFTPFAELIHHERLTREAVEPSHLLEREGLLFKNKWARRLALGDPYGNSNLPLRDETHLERFFDRVCHEGKNIPLSDRSTCFKTFQEIDNYYSYSVIILNKDKPDVLKRCIDALQKGLDGERAEIIIGDTGTDDSITLSYYDEIKDRCKVIYLGQYHYSRNNNALAAAAKNNILLFLNNDVFVTRGFLFSLGKYFLFPTIGIVGSKLLFEDGRVQHVGTEFVREGPYKYLGYHPFRGKVESEGTLGVQETPAVTGACLMIPRDLFFRVGGFDETFQAECQDTDLCLKIKQAGYKTICSLENDPIHLENATRPKGEENWNDRNIFIKRWKEYIENEYLTSTEQSNVYNPNILFIRERERGDVLASSAIVREFKKKYPMAIIDYKTKYADLMVSNRYINKIVENTDPMTYECIIELTYEIGNWEEADSWLITLFKSAGFRKQEINYEMQYPDYFVKKDEEYEKGLPFQYIVIGPNAGWFPREWTYDKWVLLIKYIKQRLNIPVIQVGAHNDKFIPGCIDGRGQSFNRLGILMSKASFFIGVDSFPMHMALALLPQKRNMIILTCPTSKTSIFIGDAIEIRNEGCTSCRKRIGEGLEVLQCKTPLIKEIPVESVFDRLKSQLLNNVT